LAADERGSRFRNSRLSLYPGCHAKVERTKIVLSEMTPLLLELWREQHPAGREQIMLGFTLREPVAQAVPFSKKRPKGIEGS
jgi:hypothetical protein